MCRLIFFMGDLKQMGIPITLDCERRFIFNLNVLEACIERYGGIDKMLAVETPLKDLMEARWLAAQMLNEDAEIWNEEHPDDKKSMMDEKRVARYMDGMGGINEFQRKVREAILKGLPQQTIEEVEEAGKNLIAAQSGRTMNREQRRKQPRQK